MTVSLWTLIAKYFPGGLPSLTAISLVSAGPWRLSLKKSFSLTVKKLIALNFLWSNF